MTLTLQQPQQQPRTIRLITHSSQACFLTCQRKYWLRYQLGIRPKHDADALRVGSMWHYDVDLYEGGKPIDEAIAAVRAEYESTQRPPWTDPLDYDVERETVCAMVRGHYERYAADAIIETLAVELPFALPIRNPSTNAQTPTFRSAGKIDRIGRLPDGRIAVIERKTAGESLEPDSNYWKRWLIDSQISRYFLAAREAGYEVETVVIDVMRKPAIKPSRVTKANRAWATSQGNYHGIKLDGQCPESETPEMYGARLLADLRDPERHSFYFRRMEIPRLEHDLKDYQAEQWSIQRSIRAAELDEREWGAAAWPRNTNACTGFSGCEYLDVCRGLRGDPTEETPEGFIRVDDVHPELSTHQ